MQCIHQVSMLLAEEGDEANAATATACPNLRPTNRPPVAAVQTLPRKAQEHEADQTLPRKAQDCKESPRSLNMLPRKTSSPPPPPNVPVHVFFTGTCLYRYMSCSIISTQLSLCANLGFSASMAWLTAAPSPTSGSRPPPPWGVLLDGTPPYDGELIVDSLRAELEREWAALLDA